MVSGKPWPRAKTSSAVVGAGMAAVRQPTKRLSAAPRVVRQSLSAARSVGPWARQGPLEPAAAEAAAAPALARARRQRQASSSILREGGGRSPSHRFLSDRGELRTKMKEAP